MTTKHDRFRAALTLSAAGDALGWITEFEAGPEALRQKYGVEAVTEFVDWEKHVGGRFLGYVDKIKAGSYSDDTQLTLAVARCIGPGGVVDHDRFAKVELANWRYYDRGGGRTVKAAAEKIARKSARWDANFFTYGPADRRIDYRDCGANGVVMRVLPIALASCNQPATLAHRIFSHGLVTHGHPRALLGAVLYGLAVDGLLRETPDSFQPVPFLRRLPMALREVAGVALVERPEFTPWLWTWNQDRPETYQDTHAQVLAEIEGAIEQVAAALESGLDPQSVLSGLGAFEKASKGSGTVTVIAALYLSARQADSPRDAVLAAVNAFGADTDSLASVVGGLLGALHGMDAVPETWRNVQDGAYMATIARRLADGEGLTAGPFEAEGADIDALVADGVTEGGRFRFAPIGMGTVEGIKRKDTVTSGKYALLVKVAFDAGQSCVFSVLCPKRTPAMT